MDHLAGMGQLEIARSWRSRMAHLLSAGGAGAITALTVFLKVLILHSPLPALTGYLLSTLNFVGSFLLMQLLGFRLATKLSSLFGATLGRRWRAVGQKELRWSLHTQLLSALGNLALVVPTTLIFHELFTFGFEQSLLSQDSARVLLRSLDPWRTGTLLYASLTGALLWGSTWLGGLLAGRAGVFSKSTATVLFNVCLGTLLALIPAIGHLLQLPLEVRHFTLSSGSVAVAVATLGIRGALEAGLLTAMVGVLAIGILNFSVSFGLAFVSARER